MTKLYRFSFIALGWAAVLASSPQARAESRRLEELAHFDKYHEAKYSNGWGYTAPDGREYALVGVRTGTSIVDISDTKNLREVAFIPATKSEWREIKVYRNYAYVATEAKQGVQIIDLSDLPRSAKLVNTFKGVMKVHDLQVDAQNGTLYLVGGDTNMALILSLADPENPTEISSFNAPIYVHDIFIRDNRAYLSEIKNRSFAIYDVSNLKAPKLLKRVPIPGAGRISSHNAWLTEDSNFLITTEEAQGRTVKMWDIRDLNNITMVSEYLGENGLAHNAHIKGRYAYLSHYGAGLKILDISNPYKMVEVAHHDKADPTTLKGFVAAWGTYPYFKSGKIPIFDIEDGLFVVDFEGAKE